MTQQPPPYGPPPVAPRPAKPRPSAWWFGVGITLVVAAVGAGIGLFVWTLGSFLHTDATVAADGRPHVLEVETDGERMLWTDESVVAPRCEVVDRASGERVHLRPAAGTFRRENGSPGDWIGSWRFDPGSGELEVTCTGSFEGEEIQIGAAPRVRSLVVGILATIVVPLGLGLAGLAVLLVTGILWSLRPASPARTG
ncbi:MAG TPA: hypothetical protein VD864_05085 [Nocardioides sp.]|nr:hypothetical protein [Nocardioides sp.]